MRFDRSTRAPSPVKGGHQTPGTQAAKGEGWTKFTNVPTCLHGTGNSTVILEEDGVILEEDGKPKLIPRLKKGQQIPAPFFTPKVSLS